MLVHTATTMGRRGLLRPGRPDRLARQLWALYKHGYGLPGELRSAAARDPGRLAVVDETHRLTYRQLLSSVTARADQLSRTIGSGQRVGLLRRNSAAFVIDVIACAMAGIDVVLMNTHLGTSQLGEASAAQGIVAWLRDDEFAEVDAFTPPGVPDADRPRIDRDGRVIVLTSGTTGLPKGAKRPAAAGIAPLISILSRIPVQARDRVLISAPMFHTWGYAALQVCLAMRATIVLRARFDAADAVDTLDRERCDVLFAVPVMLGRLLDVRAPREARLRVAAVSGSSLPAGLATRFMDRYGDVLYNLYGSTEASWVSIATPAELRAHPDTAGRPPEGTRVSIVDGAIHVANDMLFDGYTNGADAGRAEGLLATGDLGHWGPSGLLFVDGRSDDMIITGGENIHPSTVEAAVLKLDQVDQVAVFGVPDPDFGQRPAAWVVLRPGVMADADMIRKTVRDHAPRYCVPRDVHFVDELPRNAAGKIVRRLLPGV